MEPGAASRDGKSKSSVFGLAFDFLHALLGLVEPTLDRPLEHDFSREYARIARLCLAVGDYSPLLVTPRLQAHVERLGHHSGIQRYGHLASRRGKAATGFPSGLLVRE